MRPSMTARRPGAGLLYLITSGLLWGTGGLTGSLLSRVAGLSPMSVAACRLSAGGVLIVIFLTVTGRRWPRRSHGCPQGPSDDSSSSDSRLPGRPG